MTFLLDTNALSEPLRPQPSARFLLRLREAQASLAIASVTWHEALFGMHRMPEGKRKRAVHDYLYEVVFATVRVLPYDAAAAEWHARERVRLATRGKSAPYADGQIAAIARVNRLILVTANVRDFRGFEGLELQNWAK